MNLSETLTYTDIRQLHKLAKDWNCECNVHSKNELIQSLFHQLTNKYQIHQEFIELSAEEKNFLFNLMYESRNEYSKEAVYARSRQVFKEEKQKGNYRKMLERALEKGWLFRINIRQDEKFILPDEVRKQWRSLFLKEIQGIREEEVQTGVLYDGTHHMVQDLERLLHLLGKQPVQIAKNGSMYRKQAVHLLALMHIQEELPSDDWRFGYGRRFREYPDRFALLYDYAYYRKWIGEDLELANVFITDLGQQLLLQGIQQDEAAKDLIAFWLLTYRKAIPNIENISRFISYQCQNKWIEEKALVQNLIPFTSSFYYDSSEDVLKKRIIAMMVYLGILVKATLCDATSAFTMSPGGETWLCGKNF